MSEAILRLNAALEGRYRIDRELGQGGMATVYLADDLRHERQVALKLLKPELAAVVGAERFLSEIKTTAKLQHPHILPLFDSGEAGGFLFYVMPYVEGESLRERLDREKQLSVADAVTLTRKVADALDHAHGRGVVHRDIKPGNILLSERGEPLVADFGIALAVAQAGGGRLTETGLSMGTPHYMSPEQAAGDRDVDPRSDVYALACVLYEMLGGEPPFSGSTAQAILAKILTTEAAPITMARRTVPFHVEAALTRALEKLPADRFASAAEFERALGDEGFTYATRARGPLTSTIGAAPPEASQPPRPWLRDPRSLVALAALVLVALWGALRGGPAPVAVPAIPFRATLTDFELRAPGGSGNRIAISRDGSQIALASFSNGGSRLYLRGSGQRTFREVPGTEGASHPTFSPDGRWLAFSADGWIRRVEVAGGPVLPVTEGAVPHWGLDDLLAFARGPEIYVIAPSGGTPTLVATDTRGGSNARPRLLPDGRALVYQGDADDGERHVRLVELDSGEITDLGLVGDNPRYVASGYLLYGSQSQALLAVPFDLAAHRVVGEPATVLPSVLVYGGGAVQFDVSDTGTAVYALSSGAPVVAGLELVLVDAAGEERASPLGPGPYGHPRFSPDGRYLAYHRDGQIWVWDRDSGANPPLTRGQLDSWPVWSRDGRFLYFSRLVGNSAQGFRIRADGSAEPEQVFSRAGNQVVAAESPDGSLLVMEPSQDRGDDLLVATLGAGGVTFTNYLVAPWNERYPALSPDGARLAYVSSESGTEEVYVRAFPDPVGQVRVSDAGGTDPVWAPDGRAVYYLSGGALWRAELSGAGVGERRRMFEGRWASRPGSAPVTSYDVHPDGRSFVFLRLPEVANTTDEADAGPPLLEVEVVVNWFEELRERVPVD